MNSGRSNRYQKQRLLINGAVEGKQEMLYFKRLKDLIDQQPQEAIRKTMIINLKNAGGFSPINVVNRAADAKTFSNDNQYHAVFDHDNKQSDFIVALEHCRRKEISPCFSNVCFDLWLLLHKCEFNRQVCNTDDYMSQIKKTFDLGNVNIKSEHVIKKILNQIELEDVIRAIRYAENISRLNRENNRNEICRTKYKKENLICFENPDLSIHLFVKEILDECLGRNYLRILLP